MKYTCKIIVTEEYLKKLSEKVSFCDVEGTAGVSLVKTTWGDFRIEFYLPREKIVDADATIDVFTLDPVDTLEYTLDKIVKRNPLKIL